MTAQIPHLEKRKTSLEPDAMRAKRVSKKHWSGLTALASGSHGDVDPCFCRLRRFLVVLAQSSVPTQPCERPLDNPTTRKYLKGVLTGWTPYQFQVPSTHVPDPWYQLACVGPVSPYPPQPREPTGQAYERQPSPVSILNVCRMHHHCQQQPRSVYDDVSLSSTDVLTSIIATRPPFSRRLDRLAVDDGCTGTDGATFGQTQLVT